MRAFSVLHRFGGIWRLLVPVLLIPALAGCITVGKEFSQDAVDLLKPGTTTMDEVHKMMGNPLRTGVDDGKIVWTYAYYRASLGGDLKGRDLTVKFDDQNKLTSVAFNSTDVGRPLKR